MVTLNSTISLQPRTTGTPISLGTETSGAFSLTANSTGTTIFGGAVGGGTALTSLTTNAGGTTAINGGAITTTGTQTFNDAVTLDADTTLAEVDALLAALEYTHTGDDPGALGTRLTRTYTVSIDDGDNVQPGGSAGGPAGRAATALQGVVTLVPANDAPALDLDPVSLGTGTTLGWT